MRASDCQSTNVRGRNDVTPAVPLRDELVLNERLKIACDEHVHINPHAAVVPDDEQTHEVTVDPCFFVVQPKQSASFHSCALGESGNINDTERERVWITLEVFLHNRVAAQIAV